MNKTNIAWTDFTWNPITGCTAVSEGCKNCYAKVVHERFNDTPFSEIFLHPDRLEEPLRRRKPCKIFIGSMTDLFHDDVSFEWLDEVFHIIMRTPWLTYQILTKRPERMKEYLDSLRADSWDRGEYKSRLALTEMSPLLSRTEVGGVRMPEKTMNWHGRVWDDDAYTFIFNDFSNVWFGVTAENQEQANKRVPILLNMPVKNRFVSIEPMIENINLDMLVKPNMGNRFREVASSLMGVKTMWDGYAILAEEVINKLDWVIVGGETGAKSKVREMKPEWIEKIHQDCKENGVPFFFKQWGAYKPKEQYEFESMQQFPKGINL